MRLPLGVTAMRFMGEEWPVYVIFAPEESSPLLGATALEAFSLMVDPNEGRLVPVDACCCGAGDRLVHPRLPALTNFSTRVIIAS